MSLDDRLGRRALIRAGVAGGVALATLPLGCGGGVSGPTGPVPAGNVASVAMGSLELVDGENVFLGRDDGGLYAMTAICTHQGAVISPPASSTGFAVCPRHLSTFDRNGGVVRGPASQPLQHYQVDVASDGSITIQGGRLVSSAVRTHVD